MNTNYTNNNEIYIECIDKSKKGKINIPETSQIRLLFLQKGSCSFSCATNVDVLLERNSAVLIPPYNKCVIDAAGIIQLIIFWITVDLNFCNNTPFEKLMEVEEKINKSQQNDITVLHLNKIISDYLKHTKYCLLEGLKSVEFFQMKQKELLYYFGEFYSKEELYCFFKPILTKNIAFSKAVCKINEKFHAIDEIAKSMDYSLSGFKKRFKDIYGMSAYKWLCQEKSKKLFHEITCSRKTFNQISRELRFSSQAHMCNFCIRMFGDTPKKLRAKKLLTDA
ncbi:MAG: helix-turn-helix domain-containing protein [Prevotellaceae bacterium]|jgi:AraC-like DNA-binding protein|nr:helix-turn-helix domain-containing protein [Prevotellaceae bacterium]